MIAEYKVFRGLCAFFGLNLEEIYMHLSVRSKLKDYYGTLGAFTIACSQRPMALMNKEEIRKAISVLTTRLRDDVFRAMNHPYLYESIQKKWMI